MFNTNWDPEDYQPLTERIESRFGRKTGHKRGCVSAVLSVFFVFSILVALITPAIATTGALNGGNEEETTAADIGADYDAESDGTVLPTGHVHTDACYGIIRELTCGMEESEGHVHTAECYAAQEEQASSEGAGSETAVTERRLVCGMEEHIHTDACYGEAMPGNGADPAAEQAAPVTERVLVCGYEDGQEIAPAQYSEPVYGDPVIDEETGEILEEAPLLEEAHLVSEAVIHHHSDACYEEVVTVPEKETTDGAETGDAAGTEGGERPLICGKEEHVHSDACYEEVVLSAGSESAGSAGKPETSAPGTEQGAADADTQQPASASNPAQGTLICGMEEGEGAHKHDDSCYTERRVLICGMEEGEFTEEELALLEELKKKEQEKAAAAESTVFFEQTVQYTEDEELRVTVTAPEGAFPANTEMIVEIIEDEETLTAITEAVDTAEAEIADSEERGSGDSASNNANNGLAAVPSDAEERPVRTVRAVDITFRNEDGEEIEPALPITVVMASTVIEESDRSAVVHVDSEGQTEILDQIDQEESEVELAGDEVAFESDRFSIYAVVGTVIEKTVLASNGHNYKITVTCRSETGIPANAELSVEEILPDEDLEDGETDVWQEYASMVSEALGWEGESASYLRLFDIKIVDKDGVKIQPAEGSKVDVRIELADKDNSGEAAENTMVVHFADDADEPDVMQDVIVDGTVISFATEGFSAYAIVQGPNQISVHTIGSLDELANNPNNPFYLSYGSSPIYFTNAMNGNSCFIETAANDYAGADEWFFEKVSDEDNAHYYIYTYVNNVKQYVNNPSGNLAGLTDQNSAAIFELSAAGSGKFYFKLNEDEKWLQHSGTGNGIRFYTDKKNATNTQITITYPSSFLITEDPYKLDGKSFGLMTWNGGKTAKALMASENSETDEEGNPYPGCLEAKFLTLMSKESNSKDKLYVPNNTADTVTDWMFEWQDEDIYYLKGKDSSDAYKYLSITDEGLSLVTELDDSCLIQVVPGAAGIHKGQISLKSATGGQTLTYSGKYKQGFDIGGEAGSEWLYLVESKSEEVLANYVKVYSATKVSISDTDRVYTGQKVIIYTREWKNDHYEYYAINSEGALVPCEESGDSIEWVGGNMNDMLWQFTEYTYEGTDTPNGYYELQNLYAKSNGTPSYLAPKYSASGTTRGILSEDAVGILMEGRQNKQYYSTIDAWDTPEYMYSSLMVDMSESDPTIKPCVSRDGLNFYFAILEDLPVDDVIHTVPTVDNDQYGIKMRMIDLENGPTNDAKGQMNAFLGNTTSNGMTTVHTPGLLSTNLVNGYPTAAGGSLQYLFSQGRCVEANHLFIDSTYRATGYYEYNSTQNFAYLTDSGDFRVYKELGTNDTQSKNTLKHGQFFPYNDILPGQFASANGENLYSATGSPLPETDPRKHEQLYLVDKATDYYYAMELEASFIQTPSGLDAWGHDIIFEFSGDDDFWLYVDNELVIDLGGIHSAVPGSVNFRTGEVNVNGTRTTLYDLFYNNYKGRGHTDAEAQEYVGRIFEQNSSGQYVFKDDTPHTMRIFYMERGAGASNLHMKFNLAAVKKGTVQLSKKLDGVEESETSYAVFPYQIFYTMEGDPANTERMLRNAFNLVDTSDGYKNKFGTPETKDYVFYMDRTQPVTFQPELKIGDATYYNVFMLKPGETADINFPVIREDPEGEEITVSQYRIVECGVDPSVYTQVKVNDQVNDGTLNNDNPNIRDYDTGWATTDGRPKVNYVNKVENLQSLDITKELYKKLDGNDSPQKIELYDSNGEYLASSNVLGIEASDLVTARNAVFNYRLYFKTSNDNDFSEANRFIYHVKDPAGYYCRWDSTQNAFVRITNSDPDDPEHNYPDGTRDYRQLTDDYKDENGHTVHQDKFWSSFETGTHGSISSIPAYYTIEVRDLVPGTQYMIVERPSETDDGYKFWQYESQDSDQQAVMHTDPYDPMLGISGTIQPSGKSKARVQNYKGYGIRLKKIWADASTVKDRDPAYFAVYRVDEVGSPEELEPNSVRRLDYSAKPQELYWWYLTLPFDDTELSDYSVFEVILEGGYTVLSNGSVTVDPEYVTPVQNGGLNTLNATLNGQDTPKQTRYTVTYEIEENENDADNVLVVKTTNAPTDLPPVRFIKQDWGNNALPGAVFSLKYGELSSVFDTETKTSDTEGLIGQVYLQEGVTYTLTEVTAPQGFIGLNRQLEVRLESTASGWSLNVSSEIPSGYPRDYEVTEVEGTLSLIVRNRPYRLEMVKHDSTDSRVKLAGAIFSLYRQQSIGNQQTWDENNPVFTDLTTNGDGVIPAINSSLPAGTYQLRETQAPDGYIPLTSSEYINFTVTQQGVIELGTHSEEVTFTTTTDEQTGICTYYTVGIPNHPQPIEIIKTDEAGNNLTGAQFHLRKRSDTGIWVYLKGPEDEDLYKPIDMTAISVYEINDLPVGSYCLTETYPPDGYIISVKDHYFIIEVTTSGGTAVRTVSLCDEDGNKVTKNEWGNATLSKDDSSGIYTITIKNTPGEELPMTGGPGRGIYAFLGMLLIAAAGVLLLRPGRRLI